MKVALLLSKRNGTCLIMIMDFFHLYLLTPILGEICAYFVISDDRTKPGRPDCPTYQHSHSREWWDGCDDLTNQLSN